MTSSPSAFLLTAPVQTASLHKNASVCFKPLHSANQHCLDLLTLAACSASDIHSGLSPAAAAALLAASAVPAPSSGAMADCRTVISCWYRYGLKCSCRGEAAIASRTTGYLQEQSTTCTNISKVATDGPNKPPHTSATNDVCHHSQRSTTA